ncbi:hypothetical protein D3C81_1053850 [compost metagenome]
MGGGLAHGVDGHLPAHRGKLVEIVEVGGLRRRQRHDQASARAIEVTSAQLLHDKVKLPVVGLAGLGQLPELRHGFGAATGGDDLAEGIEAGAHFLAHLRDRVRVLCSQRHVLGQRAVAHQHADHQRALLHAVQVNHAQQPLLHRLVHRLVHAAQRGHAHGRHGRQQQHHRTECQGQSCPDTHVSQAHLSVPFSLFSMFGWSSGVHRNPGVATSAIGQAGALLERKIEIGGKVPVVRQIAASARGV